jgi:hypothetical protein
MAVGPQRTLDLLSGHEVAAMRDQGCPHEWRKAKIAARRKENQ